MHTLSRGIILKKGAFTMANEVVKYHNEMNKLAFTGFSPSELNVFYTLCSIMKEKGTTKIELSYDKLIELSGLKDSRLEESRQTKLFENMYKNLLKLTLGFDDGDKILYFNLFSHFELIRSKRTVSIGVNEDYSYILNNLANNFTRFELLEFNEISGEYPKLLYRHLKQWKVPGLWEVRIDEFRRLFDVPEWYRMSELDKWVLKPSIKELQKIKDFENLKVTKIKKGRAVDKLVFEFKEWVKPKPTRKNNKIIPKVQYELDTEEKADPEEIEKVMEKLKKVSDNDN